LKAVCTATKRNGEPCTLPPHGSGDLCWAHNPKNAERRSRGQSRGGKSKPNQEIRDIKRRLSDLADSVLDSGVDKGRGAIASQVLNVYLRAIAVELKVREQPDLAERLEALERAARTGGRKEYG
jgi:hypothetical protein